MRRIHHGIYVDAKGHWHFFPAEFCAGEGYPATPENQRTAEEAFLRAVRRHNPHAVITTLEETSGGQNPPQPPE